MSVDLPQLKKNWRGLRFEGLLIDPETSSLWWTTEEWLPSTREVK